MEIELKNIRVLESLSDETNAFSASLYIDGKKIGQAGNHGQGGNTFYNADHPDDFELLKKAETYCREQLPPYGFDDGTTMEMSLESLIDQKVEDFLAEKYRRDFECKIEKASVNSIIFGVPGSDEVTVLKLRQPIADFLKTPDDERRLFKIIAGSIPPNLPPGAKILNKNLPEQLMDIEELRRSKPNLGLVLNKTSRKPRR